MKSILVPIDFSKPSENAAHYALHVARQIKADITLCHAVHVPVEVPTEAFGSWPGYDVTTLKEEGIAALEEVASKMRDKLSAFSMPNTFNPVITCLAEVGGATDVITRLAQTSNAHLLVMGTTGVGALSRLIFGSVSRRMIDLTRLPLILVPERFLFEKIEKVGFATSLVEDDIEAIHGVAGLAKYFRADLLVVHVADADDNNEALEKKSDQFLREVTCKINYDKIYFRQVDRGHVNQGLDWLTAHGRIDLLVMVHHKQGLLENIFFSHAHAIANRLDMPLLIMPAGVHQVF
jgi:nucleotide-binding universal stress UspA family protein